MTSPGRQPPARASAANATSGAVEVLLDRWTPGLVDQRRYREAAARVAEADGATLVAPQRVVPGVSRAWLCWEGEGWRVLANGVLTLVAGDADRSVVAPLREERDNDVPRALCRAPDVPETVLYAETLSTALLLLDDLARIERLTRPHALARFVGARFAELGRPLRDARLRRVYRASLVGDRERAGAYWDRAVRPDAAAARRDGHPLGDVLEPLEAFSVERDEREIRAEQDRAVRRVALGAGGIGAATGALLPELLVSDTTAALTAVGALAAVAVAVAAVLIVLDAARSLRSARVSCDRSDDRPAEGEPSVGELVAALRARGGTIVVGTRMGAVDFACAAMLWIGLLERGVDGRLATQLDEGSDRVQVVVGGPLVRATCPWEPVAELRPVDAISSAWGYVARGEVLARAGVDDSIGCLSSAPGAPAVLFLTGLRDGRAPAGRLREALEYDGDGVPELERLDAAWLLVRGGLGAFR